MAVRGETHRAVAQVLLLAAFAACTSDSPGSTPRSPLSSTTAEGAIAAHQADPLPANGAPLPAKEAPPLSLAVPRVNPWTEPARVVLIRACGKCHDGDRETAVAEALAVFDLAETLWQARMSREQLDTMSRRIRGSKDLSLVERASMESFFGCARDGDCG